MYTSESEVLTAEPYDISLLLRDDDPEITPTELRHSGYLWPTQALGSAILTGAVILSLPAGVAIANSLPHHQNESPQSPPLSDIYGGVMSFVVGHRPSAACQKTAEDPARVLSCTGEPNGTQLNIEQCQPDVVHARHEIKTVSFTKDRNEFNRNCYSDWIAVTQEVWRTTPDATKYFVPGVPTERVPE